MLTQSVISPLSMQPLPASGNLQNDLKTHGGVLFFHIHFDASSFDYFEDNIASLPANTITTCYFEIPESLQQIFATAFQTKDMYALKSKFKSLGWEEPKFLRILKTIERCINNHIRIVPVDREVDLVYCYEGPGESLEETEKKIADSIQDRNKFMAENIKNDLKNNPGNYIGLFGLLHHRLASILEVASIGLLPHENSFIVGETHTLATAFTPEEYRYYDSFRDDFSIALKPLSPLASPIKSIQALCLHGFFKIKSMIWNDDIEIKKSQLAPRYSISS